MKGGRVAIILFWVGLRLLCAREILAQAGSSDTFVNWETAPVHPIALSPDAEALAVCNLPDNRLELFDVSGDVARPLGSIPVGLDPVTVRFRTATEIWVVNHISDSISVVDLASQRIVATITTLDSPADVVFAGSPPRAFVSCVMPNQVQVFDATLRVNLATIPIDGERPKAMAVSPNGDRIYVAILESGNASTILAPSLTKLTGLPPASAVDFHFGPHAGTNPPPNSETGLMPHFNPKLGTNLPPRVGLIVKRNSNGRWMDDHQGDWTEFVSGTNAFLSGRQPGWDVADHDLAIIDPATLRVNYVRGLMNICLDVAVNPATGKIAVIGTDALNHIRFEPVLNGIFVSIRLGLVNPLNGTSSIKDLNPQIDYRRSSVSRLLRKQSLGDPRGVLWNASGDRLFVTGMGSNNLLILDGEGNRVGDPIALPAGPTGLALDERRRRLYVLNRFDASISVVDTESRAIASTIKLFDPTPDEIRRGREHFYNTFQTSGLGQASCASCHVDGRVDRLAWDLGNPTGEMKIITRTNINFARFPPPSTNHFHPMKGPMVTQTLQDIIGHEPFHWRGDRDGLEDFNPTFTDLQGADAELTDQAMQEFEDFLATIHFPPNPFRNLDNSLPTRLPLPSQLALGRGNRFRGEPLPDGNAQAGLTLFRTAANLDCISCHTLPSGLGPDMRFVSGRWTNVPSGPRGEHHAAVVAVDRSAQLPFKIAQLRNLPDKIGFALGSTNSRAGFGFFHDGRVDSLARFLQDGFDIIDDQQTSNLIAFLLAFNGSDLPPGSVTDQLRAPGLPSRDVHAAVGTQITFNGSEPVLILQVLIDLVRTRANRVGLVARGFKDGVPRGWFFDPSRETFQSDRGGERESLTNLLTQASSTSPLTFTVVPAASAPRLGVDRDADGFFDRTELDSGSDPADPLSVPGNQAPRFEPIADRIILKGETFSFRARAADPDAGQAVRFSLETGAPAAASLDAATGEFFWKPNPSQNPGDYRVTIQANDDGTPSLTNRVSFKVTVSDGTFRIAGVKLKSGQVELEWETLPGKKYRVLSKENLELPDWRPLGKDIIAEADAARMQDAVPSRSPRYYRVELVP